ncbi:hypothetical protein [Staphylococcus canis]|uniref:ABC transporter permease n=1 Tax=Staphylococcus canis TaxID=2724942 RepID=A0ABS0TAL0_9STAP|nr:hypothetical protein [Staphylococcus canis]MBI5975780.1 hypothetical protein [Staphylococcus canis]
MRQTIAFFTYYMKMLMKDKITLMWNVLFPLVLALMGVFSQNVHHMSLTDKQSYIFMFWAFAIVMIYINGIGTQFATIRQHGLLKSFYSLSGKKLPFLIAIILSQIVVGVTTIALLAIVLGTYLDILSFKLLLQLLLYGIIIIPLAPAFLFIAFLPVKSESLTTITSILAIIMFFIAGSTNNRFLGLEWLNPVYFFRKLALGLSNFSINDVSIIAVYIIYIIIGIMSLVKIDINSKSSRT